MPTEEEQHEETLYAAHATAFFDEKNRIAEAMKRYGGSFVQALGEALMRADPINARKIKDTWPDYWREYTSYADLVRQEDEE